MDGERWFRVYRVIFFVALFVTTIVRLYFVLGFPPELADRVGGRFLSGFDLNLWTARLGSVALVLTLAAGAALVLSLVTRTYWKHDQGQDHSPTNG